MVKHESEKSSVKSSWDKVGFYVAKKPKKNTVIKVVWRR